MDAQHPDYSVEMAEAGPIAGRVIGPGTNEAAVALCLPHPENVGKKFCLKLSMQLTSIGLQREFAENMVSSLK